MDLLLTIIAFVRYMQEVVRTTDVDEELSEMRRKGKEVYDVIPVE